MNIKTHLRLTTDVPIRIEWHFVPNKDKTQKNNRHYDIFIQLILPIGGALWYIPSFENCLQHSTWIFDQNREKMQKQVIHLYK
jgi:hypothetical protein